MSLCVTVPTETQFQTFTTTSGSLFTTFSVSTTTLPPTTVTSTSTICLDPITLSGTASCGSSTLSLVTSVNSGQVSTSQVPTTNTIPVTVTTSTPTLTLFSTECTNGPTSPVVNPPSTSPPSDTSSSSSTTVSSTTLPNGSVVVTTVITTSLEASSVTVTAPPAPSLNNPDKQSSSSSSHKGAIIGGAVGGTVALIAVIGAIWYIWRRANSWDDIFDEEEEKVNRPRMELDSEDVQPRPYHYGLVGNSGTPTPPHSPPSRSMELGYAYSTSALVPPMGSHSRSSSGGAISVTDPLLVRSTPDVSLQSNGSRPNYRHNISASSTSSQRPLLERPVNRPSSAGQTTIGFDSRPSSSRSIPADATSPTSAGSGPQTSFDIPPVPVIPSLRSEKQRLMQLPPGAAAPSIPSASAGISTNPNVVSPTQMSQPDPAPAPMEATPAAPTIPAASQAPPLSPRNPARPSTGKSSKSVVVHRDGGPAPQESSPQEPQQTPQGAPPAYSPT